jgi:hypothetical protein
MTKNKTIQTGIETQQKEKKELARNLKGRTVGRKVRLEMFRQVSRIKLT